MHYASGYLTIIVYVMAKVPKRVRYLIDVTFLNNATGRQTTEAIPMKAQVCQYSELLGLTQSTLY